MRGLGNCEIEREVKIPPGGGIFGGELMLLRWMGPEKGISGGVCGGGGWWCGGLDRGDSGQDEEGDPRYRRSQLGGRRMIFCTE